jgi:hypothetical protein
MDGHVSEGRATIGYLPQLPETEGGRHGLAFGTRPSPHFYGIDEVYQALVHEMGHVLGLIHEHQVCYRSNKLSADY